MNVENIIRGKERHFIWINGSYKNGGIIILNLPSKCKKPKFEDLGRKIDKFIIIDEYLNTNLSNY